MHPRTVESRPKLHPSFTVCLFHIPPALTPCSHTYPLTLNFAVKPLRTARAQRQMFPIEMRIDFPNGLCNQQFVHFHFDKKVVRGIAAVMIVPAGN